MRYNKQELFALASLTSQNFDREGVLILKEKQDGFFRRSEGYSLRWFRLKGNLLFYLKGPEPWYEPMGVIVLGHHQVKIQAQDENGHWPFQIVWENGVCYRLATYHQSEQTLWLQAIKMASFEYINSQIASMQEQLNKVKPIEISSYRMQKGIMTDMNEVPLCELALSCDNLLCDAHGQPPSPMAVVYVKYPKGLNVKYGSTEIVDKCSNPSFSKTILFLASDGLTGDAIVRIVIYDVRERVSNTSVPMGYTSLQLSTIQEAQRLRVALNTRENKVIGFVTLNGWSLEPSYIGTSPSHSNDRNSVDIPQKVLCHRRSQSLPPRLGLKLKFPSYGNLLKQNFVNSHQVTFRFHSGLGGDITVHEIMAEPKLCYQMPMQLLDIYIQREKELLDELLSVGEICGQWQTRQLELVSVHLSLLKHYSHSKRCMEQVDNMYFKASTRKDDASLEFAPVNLHLQRMWVHNDTLNKTGFHDVITAGAFAAHTHKVERTGGLIRLVQEVKDVNSSKAELNSATNKIQTEYDNVMAVTRLRDDALNEVDRAVMLLQANQTAEIPTLVEAIKYKVKNILTLWDPKAVEEALSHIGWPKNHGMVETESEVVPMKMSTVMRLTEQLSLFDTMSSEENYDASSSSSSKETTPTMDLPLLPSSMPKLYPPKGGKDHKDIKLHEGAELQFHNNYFERDREERGRSSFRSLRPRPKSHESQGTSFESSRVRHGVSKKDFTVTSTSEQASIKCLMESINLNEMSKSSTPVKKPGNAAQSEAGQPENNLEYLKCVGTSLDGSLTALTDILVGHIDANKSVTDEVLESIKQNTDSVRQYADEVSRWLRVSHAALRLRFEAPHYSKEHAALQTRRDTCFSQALATVTTGLLCWLCSVPADVVVKLLTSGLGPLCEFEGLLSLYSSEKAMWGDMVVAVEDLHTVVFVLTKVAHSNSAIPHVTGTRGSLTVNIPVSESLYSKFTSKEHLRFTITAVFFNIGINEKAVLAKVQGETTQQHSNKDNLERITKYYHKYSKLFPGDHHTAARTSSRTKPLEEVMENLRIAVHKKVTKNVEVLQLASLASRLMNGVRFTSCKSAKDRTGMSVTLEQVAILAGEYHLADHELKKALSIMRSEGCRRENTFKNIGIRKYAFTKKQVAALPTDYRPPAGTYGSSQT